MDWAVSHEFPTEEHAIEYAIHCQRDRRNLTDAEILSCIIALDKRKKTGPKPSDNSATDVAKPSRSSQETAEKLGIDRGKIERARTVQDHGDEETKPKLYLKDPNLDGAEITWLHAREETRGIHRVPGQSQFRDIHSYATARLLTCLNRHPRQSDRPV